MSFTIGLLELFAYVLPGGLVLLALVYVSNPSVIDQILSRSSLQVAFVVGSYIIGHLLTQISIILTYARMGLKWSGFLKKRDKRLSFHKELQEKLTTIFGSTMTKNDFSDILILCSHRTLRLQSCLQVIPRTCNESNRFTWTMCLNAAR